MIKFERDRCAKCFKFSGPIYVLRDVDGEEIIVLCMDCVGIERESMSSDTAFMKRRGATTRAG